MTLNGNSDETNGYNSVAKNGEVSNVNFIKSMVCPIGTVVSWLKTFTNTPSLPDGWVECDGAVLSDSDSPYDGETIPDLNGDNRFLRGNSTSGGTGGSATMAHTHTLTLGDTFDNRLVSSTIAGFQSGDPSNNLEVFETGGAVDGVKNPTGTTSAASNTENRPPFYDVVWIMRVK